MAALTALRPEVMPHVASCPLPMVDNSILKAVIDFCNRSRAYRFTPADITVIAGTANYSVADLPSGVEIAWLLSADLDGVPLDLPDSGSVPAAWAAESGMPTAAITVTPTSIGLRKVPDSSGVLSVRLALRPSQSGTIFPDEFNNLYQEQIASGALARLWAQPDKPWSAAGLVADARSRFEAAIHEAEYKADRGSANAPARTSLNLIGGR